MEEISDRKMFVIAFAGTLLAKIILSIAIPFTSDEALFALWGRFPGGGYYDHPPMVGWLMHLMMHIGSSAFWLRLPAVVFTQFIGLGIYLLLKKRDTPSLKASFLAILFLVSPINILNVLITTDTPLILFSFCSGALLYMALERGNYRYYVLSGAFLGAAFLSKYFAVLLGFAYAVYFIFSKKERQKTVGFCILFLAALPFVAQNIYWNYTHCWTNILFNVFNRNRAEHFSIVKMLAFLLSQSYLVTPPVIYYLAVRRRELLPRIRQNRPAIMLAAFLVPLAVFGVLSAKKMIGLHWVLAFYPFMYVALFPLLTEADLIKSIKFMTAFSIVHLFLIATILSLPVSLAKSNKNFNMIVLGTNPGAIIRELMPYEKDFQFATPSYATSALLTYQRRYNKYFAVFGGGSQHGRQDDILTDFRALDGKNILVMQESKPMSGDFERFFVRVEIKQFSVQDARFYLVLGYGFNYIAYKEKILTPIRDQFYNIPAFLPTASCYFLDRYFGGRHVSATK
jgi:hypothetical protein